MTIPSMITSSTEAQKAAAAAADYEDGRSTIGYATSEAPIYSYGSHVVQTMKLAKMIALSCLAMTAVLALFVMVNSSAKCDCRENGLESRVGNPFYEPLMASSEDKTMKRLPLRLQMEGDAGELFKKNKKGKVNCSVERKVATQIIASEPKLLITPYGNITTDPRIIHMTGEKMIFTCNTGKSSKKDRMDKDGDKKESRKFGTVINLNDLEKDEKDFIESTTPTTTSSGASPLERPKRSPDGAYNKKAHMTCDCHCPQDDAVN